MTLLKWATKGFVYAFEKQVREAFFYALFMAFYTSSACLFGAGGLPLVTEPSANESPESESSPMAEMTMDLADKEAGALALLRELRLMRLRDKQVIVRVASKGQIKTYRYVKKQEQK